MSNEIKEAYQKAKFNWIVLKWAALGPALMGIGISQAVYGWAGVTVYLRFVYPTICILLGLLIFAFTVLCFLPSSEEDLATADCPECGEQLRSAQAQQCFDCGADWHHSAEETS